MKKHVMLRLIGAATCLLIVFMIASAFNAPDTKTGKELRRHCITRPPFPESDRQPVLDIYACGDIYHSESAIITTCNPGFTNCQFAYCNDWLEGCFKYEWHETLTTPSKK